MSGVERALIAAARGFGFNSVWVERRAAEPIVNVTARRPCRHLARTEINERALLDARDLASVLFGVLERLDGQRCYCVRRDV